MAHKLDVNLNQIREVINHVCKKNKIRVFQMMETKMNLI